MLELPESWDEYLEGLSGKDRHELRRKMRRLERELPGTTVRSHAAPRRLGRGHDAEFLTLHRLSKVGKARFMDERMEALLPGRHARPRRGGLGAAVVPRVEGAAVASFLCLEYAGCVGLYNSGFDPAHAKLAPGIVLLAHVIRDAIERGVPVFDFLRGEEPYKYAFGPKPQDSLSHTRAPVSLRVAVLSVHTCPFAALGGKETGGMNVYVRETARELGRMGVAVDVFTRSQNASIPRVVDLGRRGARDASARGTRRRRCSGEAIHPHLPEFIEGVEALRGSEGIDYDLIHSHYWLSGVAGLRLRERWGVPLVQMFHTLGRLKNAVAQGAGGARARAPHRRGVAHRAEADRIVAANVVERAHLVWYYGAAVGANLRDPVRRRHRALPADVPAAAKDLLELPPGAAAALRGRLQPIKGLDTLLEAMAGSGGRRRLSSSGGEHDEPDERARRRAAHAGGRARPRAPRALPRARSPSGGSGCSTPRPTRR